MFTGITNHRHMVKLTDVFIPMVKLITSFMNESYKPPGHTSRKQLCSQKEERVNKFEISKKINNVISDF